MKQTHIFQTIVTAAAVILATSAGAHADLLAYDGFDYTIGANAWDGAGGAETGFSGTWATDDDWALAGVQTGNGYNNIVSGLTFGTYPVSGNAVQIISDRNGPGSRGLPTGGRAASFNSGNDYYTSYLFSLSSTTAEAQGNSEMVISATQLSGGGNADIRIVAGQSNFALFLTGTQGALGAVEVLGTTYMFVTRFAYDGVNTTATAWILEAADYDAVTLDGVVSDTELTADNFATGSLTKAGTFGITVGEFLKFTSWCGNANERVTVLDEMRVGTTLDDVLAVASSATPGTLIYGK